MRTKAVAVLVMAMGLTAAFTYLLVANHYQRQQLTILRTELSRLEAERAALEEKLVETQEQLRIARTPPPPAAKSRPAPTPKAEPASPPVSQSAAPPAQPQSPPSAEPPTSELGEPLMPVIGGYPVLPAGYWTSYVGSPTGSVCRIDGQATGSRGIIAWRVEGGLIKGRFDVDARLDLHQPASVSSGGLSRNVAARAELSIPIRSLKSQATVGAATMESRLQQALNASAYPNLYYRLGSLALVPGSSVGARRWSFLSRGQLAINGVTNDWEWLGRIEPVGRDRLKIIVEGPIQLSAFRITPPRDVVMGQPVQVHDVVNVYLSWLVVREQPEAWVR